MKFNWKSAAISVAGACAVLLCTVPASSSAETFRVYVSNEQDGTLSVISGDTLEKIATIPVGRRPRGVRPSPDGKLLYVALSGSPMAGPKVDEKTLPPPDRAQDGIGILDLEQGGKLVRVLRGVPDPEQVGISLDGKTLYVASEDSARVFVLDARDGTIRAEVDAGGEPEGVRISPDGRLVLVTAEAGNSVALMNASSHDLLATIPVGLRPRDVVFSPDSKFAYVSGEADASVSKLDVASRKVVSKVTIKGQKMMPMALALSADGKNLFLSTGRGGEIVALDAGTLAEEGRAKVGPRPWGIALSPDDKLLFAANGPSNNVSVLKTDRLEVVKTIAAGAHPWGVTVVATP